MPPLHERLADARRALMEAGIDPDEAAIDAEVLARHALGWDRAQLLTAWRDPVPAALAPAFDPLLQRRLAREPVAYIIGRREFWGRDFAVTPAVLVPRPETEIIVEEALDQARGGAATGIIVDVGTGSGCLAVTLAIEFPRARVVATDISPAALEVARRNAERHGVAARIAFLEADVLEGTGVRADLIVSNPPYVPETEAGSLPPDVARYEPHPALFGGADGLDVIRRLFAAAPARLAEQGRLVVEFGFGQEAAIRALASATGWRVVRIRPDLQGIPRTAVLRR
jgi:release factor glutamine methyltransferase